MDDFTSSLGRRVLRQLQAERIIWLTTVDRRSRPQPRPVWFFWDGSMILIYSQPRAHKVRHIARNPSISLHLNTDFEGDQVAVLLGKACLDAEVRPAHEHVEFVAKYADGIANLGMTPLEFSQEYSAPIVVELEKLRGF